ncbi:B12-binding domain-containing radical SAM protein [Desulfatibacillum aliphaticivorans]|uniref:B12-binding domain-containing radical SAM protein n=1 Tax=Desulfatibacillum aliphaticivorans TaxID=218208 RepID=UPI0003F4AE66|nr:radical SAM protein [Desulfatibacillum aliphaticivorans]
MSLSRETLTVVLINPPSLCVNDDHLEPPLGLLYIAAAVRDAGFKQIGVFDMSGCSDRQDIDKKIESIPKADVYGIGIHCTTHEYAKHIVDWIRNTWSSSYIVVGGANPSALPELTLHDLGVDLVVVGEGENAMISCLDSYIDGTPKAGVLQGTHVEDIDTLSFPARDLVNNSGYSRKLLNESVISLLASRGCPHRCAFCNSVVMGGGARRVAFRSPLSIAKEVEALRDQCRFFRFNDDCFTEHPNLDEVLDRLTGLDISFRIFGRVSHLTEKNCLSLKRAGCVHMSVGLESLNPQNLKILNKGGQIGQEWRVQYAAEADIVVRSFFMVGLPYDNDQNIDEYFLKATNLGLSEFSVYPLIPYPGTEIAKRPTSFGYKIINRNFRDYVQIGVNGRSCFALEHKNFGVNDVKRWRTRAEQILRNGGVIDSINSKIAK